MESSYQVKTVFVSNPERIENDVNEWLGRNGGVEIGQIQIFPMVKNNEASIMVLIIYRKETWK